MNYEKKYKEALEKARQFSEHPLEEDSSSIVEYIFPELQESEDERISKAIIDVIKSQKEQQCHIDSTIYDEMIAWLEKQGEQTINQPDFEIPFGAKDNELIEESYYIPKGYHAEISKDKVTIKKGEQKPVWSKEDERTLKGIVDEIEANKNTAPDYDLATYDRFLSWLKSIKERVQPQNTWKPSDAQMASITCAVRKMKESACYDSELVSLYQDLKKLKG